MPTFEYVGLPSHFFADREVIGSTVRLLTHQPLEPGVQLLKGECFKVVGIELGERNKRRFLLSNHRAKAVPIIGHVCELLFKFELSPQGKRDGKS